MHTTLGKIHDVRQELARSAAAIASLTVLPAGRRVAPHVHANPYLALHVLGSYCDRDERGEATINGPAALFFPAASTHEMLVGGSGLATVIVEFDSDALDRAVGRAGDGLRRSRSWVGGEAGRRAVRLARGWLSDIPARRRFDPAIAFLKWALVADSPDHAPSWLAELEKIVAADYRAPNVERWALEIGVSRSWLVRAYRHWRGEGLGEMLRRRRVEAAALLLESSDLQLAEIAAEAGFCDQSHMNRAFKKHIGRTPAVARAAQLGLSGRSERAGMKAVEIRRLHEGMPMSAERRLP